MTLLDMQRVLGRMLTDGPFRRAFMAGDPLVRAAYDLSPRELAGLDGLAAGHGDRVTQHARNLAHGRLEFAMGALPLTSLLLREAIHDRLGRYVVEHPPIPRQDNPMLVEVSRMCDFALGLLASGEVGPAYARDVVQYERTSIFLRADRGPADSAARVAALNDAAPDGPFGPSELVPVSGPHAVVEAFRHDLADLLPRLDGGERPAEADVPFAPTLLLVVKVKGILQTRTHRVNTATAALLDACDGHRSLSEIHRGLPFASDLGDLVNLAFRLRELGVLALCPPGLPFAHAAVGGEDRVRDRRSVR